MIAARSKLFIFKKIKAKNNCGSFSKIDVFLFFVCLFFCLFVVFCCCLFFTQMRACHGSALSTMSYAHNVS